MRKALITLAALLFTLLSFAQNAKYVFFFIGDGMGVNTINAAQYYRAAMQQQHGTLPLNFSEFPVVGISTTWSFNKEVTDSAASGTALATGEKTNNGYIGNNPEGKPIKNIAEKAAEKGRKVAVVTTVGVNHATPGAFSAHQNSRNSLDEIYRDQLKNGFDFYAGSTVLRNKKDKIEGFDYEKDAVSAGYTFVTSKEDFQKKFKKAQKIMFLPDEEHAVTQAIDRSTVAGGKATTLTDMVETAVDFMMKDGCPDGFFMMAEGGRVDYATHANDGAATILEIFDLEQAVDFALEFYRQHPGETAILVTSDHDTGGPTIMPKDKEHIYYLSAQKYSSGVLTKMLKDQLKKCDNKMSWEQVKGFISENIGLWSKVKVDENDEKALMETYENTIAKAATGNVSDEYGHTNNAIIVAQALKIFNSYSGINWATNNHSGGFAPVFYIGPRQELFSGMNDNALISKNVEKLMFD